MGPLHAFLHRLEAIEELLTRRGNVIRFLLGRLLLMGLMLAVFVVSLQRS